MIQLGWVLVVIFYFRRFATPQTGRQILRHLTARTASVQEDRAIRALSISRAGLELGDAPANFCLAHQSRLGSIGKSCSSDRVPSDDCAHCTSLRLQIRPPVPGAIRSEWWRP